MDGVIIDSMPYHFLAWYEALRPFGIRVSCFDVYAKEGERWDKSLKFFLDDAGIKPTRKLLKQIFSLRQKIFKKYFKRFIFKGAGEFIVCLKNRGYKLALVSGTPTEEVKKILPPKLWRLFDCIVAGDNVKKGKPHPEPYLQAVKKLGVNKSACVVIENAPFGIESAIKAGLFCFAVTTSLPKEYLRGADVIVDSLDEITGVINKKCAI